MTATLQQFCLVWQTRAIVPAGNKNT